MLGNIPSQLTDVPLHLKSKMPGYVSTTWDLSTYIPFVLDFQRLEGHRTQNTVRNHHGNQSDVREEARYRLPGVMETLPAGALRLVVDLGVRLVTGHGLTPLDRFKTSHATTGREKTCKSNGWSDRQWRVGAIFKAPHVMRSTEIDFREVLHFSFIIRGQLKYLRWS